MKIIVFNLKDTELLENLKKMKTKINFNINMEVEDIVF